MKPIRTLLTLFVLIFATSPLLAQTSFPMLGSTFPVGVERGKTTEVTVYAAGNGGANLYGAYKALFGGEGVKAEIVPPEKGWPARDMAKPWAIPGVGEVKMRVTVAPDAPLGVREFRVGLPVHGTSTIGQLVITDETEITEVEPNNDPEKAQSVSIPCAINGKFQQGEDVDNYKFKVAAGQEVVFAVQCARLEDKVHDLQEHADPLLILRDMAGNELDRNDDYYRADSLLHHKFAKAGEYVLQIRDVNFKGNAQWVYRVSATLRPYVTAVLPCAVEPGKSATLHLYGYNLPQTTAQIDVPANTPLGLWTTPLKLPNGTTNLVTLLVTNAPQTYVDRGPMADSKTIPAALTNAPKEPATPLALPGGVNSWLKQDGQIDRYKFTGKKGMPWGFEVMSRRLMASMDSEIKVRNAKGDVLASNDDAAGKDSRLDWTVPEDGEYTVEIRDITNHSGPTFFYNLTAQPLRPDFRLKCDTDRMMLAPGNRTTWYVQVERKYGFAGEIKIDVSGLPAGMSVLPLTISPQMSVGTLFFSVAPGAKIDCALLKVTGTAMLPGADGKPTAVSHDVHPVSEIYMPGGGRGLLEVQTQAVGISETNDLEVTVSTQTVTLQPNGEVKIEVTIKRRPDYTKAVTLDARVQHLGGIFVDPLPPGVTIQDATIPENQTKGTIVLKASGDAKPIQNLPIAIFANSSINFVMKAWYSAPPVMLTVEPPKK